MNVRFQVAGVFLKDMTLSKLAMEIVMTSGVTKTLCAALALFVGTTGYVAAGESLEPPQRPTLFNPLATQTRTVAEMKQQFADLSAALEKLQADRVAANR